MRKLSLSDWAHLAEVITSVFVITSIIYVGIELRQNTQELQLASYLGTQESMINGDLTVAANADLNLIVMQAGSASNATSLISREAGLASIKDTFATGCLED
jgi:hypothetical protein